MRILIALLLCPALWGAGLTCKPANGPGTRNWTDPAAWTTCGGGVPGDGDFVAGAPTGNPTIRLNADVGTAIGGGIKRIDVDAWTFTYDAAAPRTIRFASTCSGTDSGTVCDPMGSGTYTSPGTDANMFGLRARAGGVIDLQATKEAPLTLTTVDSTSPIYINKPFNTAPSTIRGRYWIINNLGTPQQIVSVTLTSGGTGYADGTYALTFSGGSCLPVPAATYTASGGSVVSINLTARGECALGSTVAFPSGGGSGAAATVRTSVTFDGIHMDPQNSGSVLDMQYCQILNHYRLVNEYGRSGAHFQTITWAHNESRGRRSRQGLFIRKEHAANLLVVTDNTDWQPVASGSFIYTSYHGTGYVFARNAVQSTDTVNTQLWANVATAGVAKVSTGGHTLESNLCYWPTRAIGFPSDDMRCIDHPQPAAGVTDTTTVIDGLVSQDGVASVGMAGTVGTASLTIRNSWLKEGLQAACSNAQGVIINQLVPVVLERNVVLVTACPDSGYSGGFGLFTYGSANGVIYDRNTVTSLTPYPNYGWGIFLGESTYTPAGKMRWNLVGNLDLCLLDGRNLSSSTSTTTYTVDTPPGSGVYGNATWACTKAYCSAKDCGPNSYVTTPGTGFQNGGTAHPHAIYGDVHGEVPRFLDPSRTGVESCDRTLLGGPGTADHFFAELARRSGHGGPRQFTGELIGACAAYLRAGWAATNLALKGAAYGGETPGAVPITTYNTPGGVVF
jgi:hypothetical protein